MKEITEAEAKRLFESKFWEPMSLRARAQFQLFTDRLCMPFEIFHEAIEDALGRPVFTHEFGLNLEGLKRQFLGVSPSPTFEEIIALIPRDRFFPIVAIVGETAKT